jgi:lipopolysaccharide/colanic/teichoic acid biosynthesis glycosyltransferase
MNESIAQRQDNGDARLHEGLTALWSLLDNAARRSLDVLISSAGMFLLAPIFLLLAVMIRRDSPGPVFYWGNRVGRNGRSFSILKFRTMYETAASYRGPGITGKDDPRITPFGHWLRDTKINELPQLWNVLKGDMSLVGPRPEDRDFVAHWPADVRDVLLSVRPGITSPASVLYRDEEVMLQRGNLVDKYLKIILPSKLRLDLLYVKHRSFLTDLDVIFWTLVVLLPRLKSRHVPEHLLFWGPLARFISRYFSWFVLDSVVAFAAVAVTGVLWRSSGPLQLGWGTAMGVALLIALIFSLVNALLGIGKVVWSRADLNDAFALFISSSLATATLLIANTFWQPRTLPVPYTGYKLLPSGLLAVSGVLAFAGFVVLRYRIRVITGISQFWIALRGKATPVGERVLIVGAGDVGNLAVYLLRNAELGRVFSIVGMVDDAPRKLGTTYGGVPVLGSTEEIPRLARSHDAGLILFAIENIRPATREHILALCHETHVQTVVLPDILESFRAQLSTSHMNADTADQTPMAAPGRNDEQLRPDPMENWLVEIDRLMQSQAWEAAYVQIQAMRQQMAVQETVAHPLPGPVDTS